MSEELGKVSEHLLTSTSILSHTYGAPTYARGETYQGSDVIHDEIQSLETEYVNLYHELTTKSNRLLYLNRLQELESMSDASIQERYDQVKQKFHMIAPEKLEDFLKVQIQTVKTEAILNGLLQKALPVLRAIHQANKDLNSSEMDMLTNLEKLYAQKGLNYDLMKKVESVEDSRNKYSENTVKLSNLIDTSLKPEIGTLQKLNEQLNEKSRSYIANKLERLGNEMENVSSKEQKQIQRSFQELVTKWDFLSKLCEFLPSFITSLPINWYADKDLFGIIQDCETIAERLARLQQILNVESISKYSIKDLMMLEFEEVEQGD
ncbi:uncharacterized protein CANTADRAFT_7035 [Suhomyces tanzawaensis NRRL Y-17324]|uniref:Uncharacterized protein n=1 Tax=Suhomyces tanzawaensis NRRL Y-17324 TaxID=984487 RepID=A0A1E4SGP9_9ASCO|nr:uncharacterized protein CANTADRAFT_7035 [Suhomyces tanzawaensis NRRL Y-17324]ODV78684.1 hypothetical protein CANTADRAFT_7035 [Suhomyces tanzawaensis NRRL Y-17324]